MSERHNPLRVIRWADRIQGILEGKQLGPIRANIDLTNLCNHACPWCEPLDFRKATIADKSHTLSAEVVAEVMCDLKDMDCRAIQFSGGGEPTVHREFGAMLVMAKIHGFRTLVVTNGGMVDRWIGQLGDCADHVRVSLDASCESEHQQMHGSKAGEFAKIVGNIRELVKYRGAYKWPEIGLTYNVADCNSSAESLERFFTLVHDLGVDFIQVRPLSEETPKLLTKPWSDHSEKARILANWLVKEGIRVDVQGQRSKDVFFQREFDQCYAALTLAVISANGDVCACCDERGKVFGNVNETPFRDIWLSASHRAKAANIAPKLCQRCLLCGINRGIQKFVVENEAVPELV